jgi:RimJ/RimL family protein N-acetyltransferase
MSTASLASIPVPRNCRAVQSGWKKELVTQIHHEYNESFPLFCVALLAAFFNFLVGIGIIAVLLVFEAMTGFTSTDKDETCLYESVQRKTTMLSLTTPRLLLRPFEDNDLSAVSTFRGDEQVMRYITGDAEPQEEIAGFLQRTKGYAQETPQTQFRFAVVLSESERVIGGCGLDVTHSEWREGEFGYHLHRDFWGQGYGTEVAKALLHFGFENLELHRLAADCLAANEASARIMEKIGMRQEGHFRQDKWIGGRWHDTLYYAILNEEWRTETDQHLLADSSISIHS